jgi:hypothetical protein
MAIPFGFAALTEPGIIAPDWRHEIPAACSAAEATQVMDML